MGFFTALWVHADEIAGTETAVAICDDDDDTATVVTLFPATEL